ncbi:MAG TPA: hypothetical protein VGO68_19045 [Pyrinomonadaceae bacterium]|jgi:hypothetical protein|nr:hypothetical protein [Pyrinomonadaceae bacterium]
MAPDNIEQQRKTLGALHWVYQREMAKFAEELFNYLDEDLRPRFLILGIPLNDNQAVWLEPSEDSSYTPEFFNAVRPQAEEYQADENAKNAWKNPSPENETVEISSRSIQKAVEKVLNGDTSSKVVSYCSHPETIGEYEVCCVVQFDRAAFDSHYSVPVRWQANSRLAGSLIDATAVEFLRVCRTVLSGPRKRIEGDVLGHQSEDLLRMGGRTFMLTANQFGAGTTFDDINKLSWKTHEGEIAGGEIHFIHWDEYYLEMRVKFKDPPSLSNIDAARKLIEMAGAKRKGKLHLVSHGDEIIGIGGLRDIEDKYDWRNTHVFVVKFTGYYKWELWHHRGGIMMQVISGVPSLPRQQIRREKFDEHVERTFTQAEPDKEVLWNIINAAVNQRHGTMIVISGVAAAEAERLSDQSTVLREPVKLVSELLEETLLMLTSIDGALLVDPQGTCYAAGVILDGSAIKGKGSSSRGARYNSAIRYVYGARTDPSKGECLAIVVSKDGTINLVRELNKRILRSEVTNRVEAVRAATAAGEDVNPKEYYKAILWLSDHRFYLSPAQCKELNELKEAVRLRLIAQEGQALTPRDFVPDDEMDESYFLE